MTTPALLPLSGRRIPTLSPGASSFPHHRATLRLSEKFILLLILSAFITLCFGAFFFLPDNSKHKRFDLGLEDVLIILTRPKRESTPLDREEEESLRDKIRADHERALQEAKEKLRKSREELQAEIQTEKNKVMEELKKKDAGPKPLPPVPMPKVVGVSDGEPAEPDVKEKRDKIRELLLKAAWSQPDGPSLCRMQMVLSVVSLSIDTEPAPAYLPFSAPLPSFSSPCRTTTDFKRKGGISQFRASWPTLARLEASSPLLSSLSSVSFGRLLVGISLIRGS
ncbi:hypothetical protein F7725_002334 [Dissostichus mawsoni]|uniref:Mannosyl-oligosaccharide 1,2-alpha-mannosidase IB n=1 Tax=Dissostichus mawsoni TaxID=36200 RepID=A0A7J5Y240_DISMA|nr:hypothetical protein F7725_002334 [Dissostichus mawsoni]